MLQKPKWLSQSLLLRNNYCTVLTNQHRSIKPSPSISLLEAVLSVKAVKQWRKGNSKPGQCLQEKNSQFRVVLHKSWLTGQQHSSNPSAPLEGPPRKLSHSCCTRATTEGSDLIKAGERARKTRVWFVKGTCSHFISILCWNRSGIQEVEFLWWSKHGWKDLLFSVPGSTLQAFVGAVLKTSFEMEETALKKYHRLGSCRKVLPASSLSFSKLVRKDCRAVPYIHRNTTVHTKLCPLLSVELLKCHVRWEGCGGAQRTCWFFIYLLFNLQQKAAEVAGRITAAMVGKQTWPAVMKVGPAKPKDGNASSSVSPAPTAESQQTTFTLKPGCPL